MTLSYQVNQQTNFLLALWNGRCTKFYVFSGLFRKVATCAMQISRSEAPECFYGIQELNEHFLSVPMTTPILTLQWCNILILLNFDDQTLWSEVMQTTNRQLKPGTRLVSCYQRNLNTCNSNIVLMSFILNTLNFDIYTTFHK